MTVAVLFARADSNYKELDCDVWDEARDDLRMCNYKEGLEYNKEEDEYECVFGIPK